MIGRYIYRNMAFRQEREVITDRRVFLRQAAATCLAGAFPAAWSTASQAQHYHQVAPAVPQDNERTLVFAAATLRPALDEILRAYKAAGGAEPSIAYGPTPILAKNIVDGAPADLFF